LHTRLVRFLGVGLTATATDFFIFNLALAGTGDPSPLRVLQANTLAFTCATFVGYMLNARLTFRADSDRRSLARYILVVLVGAALYNGSLALSIRAIDPGNLVALNLMKLGAVSLSATWNFCGFAFFAFRPSATQARAVTGREAGL
jgi:putative flippase GtrA